MLQHIPFPALPAPPSWFPGHMNQFKRQLPVLLKHTNVVLELRDARLPLTSINRTFEGWLAFDLSSPGWPQWPVFYTGGTVAQLRREGALVLPVQCRRTILHFLFELHCPRQHLSLVPQCPYFPRNVQLADCYKRRQ
jgi:hypothetical protein